MNPLLGILHISTDDVTRKNTMLTCSGTAKSINHRQVFPIVINLNYIVIQWALHKLLINSHRGSMEIRLMLFLKTIKYQNTIL